MATKVTINLLAGLVFSTWAVSLAALAALQNQCENDTSTGFAAGLSGVEKFSGALLTCTKVYRYWWYVAGFEVFAILGLVIANVLGAVRSQRASWAGIFAVLTLLYISKTDAFLTAQDVPSATGSHNAAGRSRTMVAGCVMTSVVNAFIILALGTESPEAVVEEEKTAEKATI